MKNFLMMALIAIVSCTCVQAQTVDPSYPATVTSSTNVEGGILLSDGKYILYGEFIDLNGVRSPGIVKFNADGSVDNTFNIGTGPNGNVMAAALQADGKILLAGRFNSFNGVNRSFLIRLNADGSVDDTFAPNIVIDSGGVDINLLVQPDGKILVTGPFTKIGGASYGGSLARFNTDGSKDVSFNATTSQVHALGIQGDGKILIGGIFTKGIARLNSDGTSDATFTLAGTGFNSMVYAIEVSSTGQIFVGGLFTEFNGTANKYLTCLDNTGALDATWQGNGKTNNYVWDFHLLPDGKLLVGGSMTSYGGITARSPWRLNADGSLDASLSVGTGATGISNINASADGDILITGSFTSYDGQPRNGVAALESNGTLKSMTVQSNFQTASWVTAVSPHGADKFLVGHRGQQVNGTPSIGLVRLNLDGTIDATFTGNSKPDYNVDVITIDQNGQILIGGAFRFYNSIATGRIARLSSTGELDATFTTNNGSGFNASTTVIVEQPDGRILVGGNFASFNGTLRKGIARLNANGTLDASFNTADGFAAATSFREVNDIAVLSDGKILVAGQFDSFGGNNVQNFIRLNADGSFDETFQIGSGVFSSGDFVEDVLVLPDGKILIGGMFNYVGGTIRNADHLALLSANGTLENGYRSANFFGIEHLERQSDGKILVLDRNSGLRRLNEDASIDPSFSAVALEYYPEGIFTSGNTIIVGGRLAAVQGYVVAGFVKIDLPSTVPPAPASLAQTVVAQTSVGLSWSDNSTDETGFYLERSTDTNTNFQVVATLPPNATTYNNTGLAGNTTYYYRLRSFNATGNSPYTNEVTATTLMTVPLAPTSLGLTVVNAGEIKLNWTDNSSNESGFEIHRSVANNVSYALLTTTSAGAITFSDIAVTDGTRYYYKVRAVNNGGASGYTTEQSAIAANPPPAAPTSIQLDVPHVSQISVSWTDNASNETGYEVQRSLTGEDIHFTTIATLNAGATGYSDNQVTENTTYYYRVKATGPESDSDFTPIRGVAFGEGGIWRLKQEFDGIARTDAVGFAVAGKGYVGLGWAGGAQTSNFRSYDPATDTWSTQVDFFGGSVRSEAAAFVIGAKAYAGTGEWLDREKDLWEYDPSTNAWTAKADFGGTARTGAIGFSVDGKGYFGLGSDDAGYTKDFWQFDPVGNAWTPVASFPGDARNGAVVFVIDNFAYAGTGYNGTTKLKDFYKYDPVANSWTAIAEFPGAARAHAVAFEVDGKGYVGTGESVDNLKDFWSYDPATNTWQQIVNFGGSARYVATAFALNNKGYVSTGFDGGNRKDLWEFTAANIEPAPIAPSNLTATVFSASQIDLQWTDNSSNETGFVIERSATNSNDFHEIATLAVGATSYSDNTGLDPATTYYYRVKITAAVGSSAYTALASATTHPLPPAAPSNLTASLGAGLEIQLTWTDNASNEAGYIIERSAGDNTAFSSIASLGAGVTSYNDVQISYSTTYYYRVKSTNDGGSSQYSNEATATTPIPPINAPSALTAEALSHRSIQLRWTDNSDNESFFSVYRSTSPSGSFISVGGTGDNATEFTDTWNVVENTTYYYKVRAGTVHYQSEYTAIASATTPKSIPAPPTNLTASYDIASDDIILEWVDASDNEEHFVIEKSLGGSDFTELTTTTGTTYTDENPGTTFQVFYRVAAKNSAGTSAFSNTAHIVITGIEPGAGIAGVRAYPNPVVDKVMVEWSSADRGEVQISFFDLAGRELKSVAYEKIGQDFLGQVDLEGLTGNAVLMMKLTMGEKIVIRRIVVR